MEPGKLLIPEGPVTIKKRTYADAAGGDWTTVESTVTTRRASIRPKTPLEIWEALQSDEQVSHDITMRYDSTLTAVTGKDHFIVLGSRTFEIVGSPFDVDEKHRQIRFVCLERK